MMEGFITRLWIMSFQAGIAVCVVFMVRILFTWIRIPKKYTYFLWAIPFLRMLIPEWAESPLSIFGAIQTMEMQLSNHSAAKNAALRPAIIMGEKATQAKAVQHTLFTQETDITYADLPILPSLFLLWVAGVGGLLVYCVLSYLKIKKRLKCCIHMQENIYQADYIETPFVFGMFTPRIYLPSDMEKEEMRYVVLHEQYHIRRGDHWMKITAFLAAVCHWFNPLCWTAFFCMCKDMEMSCDEAVIERLDISSRQKYALILLKMTTARTMQLNIPLAFGLGNPKGRIRHIMKYQKAVRPVIAAAAMALVLLVAVLLTNPQSTSMGGLKGGTVPTADTWIVRTLQDEEGKSASSMDIKRNDMGNNMIFSYHDKQYDLTDRCKEINAVMGCQEVGRYVIVKGHIGPHNGYYGIFNTITEEFERDILGAHLICKVGAGEGEDVELSDFIYSFWNDIYDGNGTLIASCRIGETEQIYNLWVESGNIYVDIMDIEAGEVVRTDMITMQ